MGVAILQLGAIDLALISAFVSQRLYAAGSGPVEGRPLILIAGGLLVMGAGLLVMAKGA